MSSQRSSTHWAEPREGQSRITLLGSHHLANPGNDEHNLEVDDMLSPSRQSELAVLRELLETGEFDNVAVEIPRDKQAQLDEQYESIGGGTAFDDESEFAEGPANIRGEAVQIGFRLADSLNLDQVHAVDSHPEPPDIDADWSIDEDPESVPYALPDFEALTRKEEQMLRSSELVDVVRSVNRMEKLQTLHLGNVTASFSSSTGEDYVGSRQVGYWYERNGRMLENLLRVTQPEEETIFIVGPSHVIPIKQLADATPATCPQSPLSLLQR